MRTRANIIIAVFFLVNIVLPQTGSCYDFNQFISDPDEREIISIFNSDDPRDLQNNYFWLKTKIPVLKRMMMNLDQSYNPMGHNAFFQLYSFCVQGEVSIPEFFDLAIALVAKQRKYNIERNISSPCFFSRVIGNHGYIEAWDEHNFTIAQNINAFFHSINSLEKFDLASTSAILPFAKTIAPCLIFPSTKRTSIEYVKKQVTYMKVLIGSTTIGLTPEAKLIIDNFLINIGSQSERLLHIRR